MAEVIAFPPREQDRVIWRCNCGCISFFARADDELECCHCGATVSNAIGGDWRKRMAEPPVEPEPVGSSEVAVTDLNSSAPALRHALGRAQVDETVAVIVIQRDGGVTTWGESGETAEQIEWFDRRIADARQMLLKKMGQKSDG